MTDLNEVKAMVTVHLKKEVDIMECVMKLSEEDVEKFHEWYMNNPYRKGIEEIKGLARKT